MKNSILPIYDFIVDAVVIGLILIMLIALGYDFSDLIMDVIRMLPSMVVDHLNESDFRNLVSNVLSVFVIIELFSTFVYYVRERVINVSMLIDTAVVFILRDILMMLYKKAFVESHLLVLATLLIVMVIARTITHYFLSDSHGRS